MAWRKVTSNAVDIKRSQIGKEFLGIYKGHKEIETKLGPQVIWNFTDEEGVPFGIYGFTNLNRAMESVAVESLVKIIYRGTLPIKTKFGMKDVHQVDVEVEVDDAPADVPEFK